MQADLSLVGCSHVEFDEEGESSKSLYKTKVDIVSVLMPQLVLSTSVCLARCGAPNSSDTPRICAECQSKTCSGWCSSDMRSIGANLRHGRLNSSSWPPRGELHYIGCHQSDSLSYRAAPRVTGLKLPRQTHEYTCSGVNCSSN